jgi:hypothetical protein
MIKKNPSNKPLPPRADGTTAPAMRLATVREACSYGRFGHTKLYDYINTGKIVAYKRGRRTMVDLDSIDTFNGSLQRIEPKTVADVMIGGAVKPTCRGAKKPSVDWSTCATALTENT